MIFNPRTDGGLGQLRTDGGRISAPPPSVGARVNLAFDIQGQIEGSRDGGVPDVVPNLRQHAYQNGLKR